MLTHPDQLAFFDFPPEWIDSVLCFLFDVMSQFVQNLIKQNLAYPHIDLLVQALENIISLKPKEISIKNMIRNYLNLSSFVVDLMNYLAPMKTHQQSYIYYKIIAIVLANFKLEEKLVFEIVEELLKQNHKNQFFLEMSIKAIDSLAAVFKVQYD